MKYRSLISGLILFALLPYTIASAMEIRLGSGDFDLDGGITPIANARFSLPTHTVSINESHYPLFGSRVFAGFNLDYFSSNSLNRFTDLASTPLTTPLPGFGGSVTDQVAQYTSIPVPADYRIHGTNLDLFLGYDLFKTPQTVFSAGLNTGISLPFLKTRNMQSDGNLVIEVLDSFRTEIRSYKLGPVLSFAWHGANWLTLSGQWIINRQTGSLKNDWIESSVNIDGTYQSLSFALQLFPAKKLGLAYLPANSFVSLGWQREDWRFDKAGIEVPGFTATTPPMLDISFDHQLVFVGAGVTF